MRALFAYFFSGRRTNVFCAFCGSERKVYQQKHVNWFELTMVAILSNVIMWTVWQEVDQRVSYIFLFGLLVMEIFVQLRRRMSLVCSDCGFDPVIYLRNPQAAAQQVKAKLALRKDDPRAWLGRPLSLRAVKPVRTEKKKPSSHLPPASTSI
jgi:hypothetical protein